MIDRQPDLQPELLSVAAMTLATSGPDGQPFAAPVYFAADLADGPLRLYFFSDPDSQHGRNLKRDPRLAAAFYPESDDWREIRGVQLRGEARPVPSGAAWDLGWRCYADKFPFVEGLKLIVARNTLYCVKPDWVRVVDNRRGFGFKEEWSRP
jgi:uncharacterized protein YhbP (UPF0306 family)